MKELVKLNDSLTILFKWMDFVLTVKCWNSHALRIFVATFGKIPRFLEFFLEVGSSSSQPSVPSPLPTLALLASPGKHVGKKSKLYLNVFKHILTYLNVYKHILTYLNVSKHIFTYLIKCDRNKCDDVIVFDSSHFNCLN
jgi:hypothetical protein